MYRCVASLALALLLPACDSSTSGKAETKTAKADASKSDPKAKAPDAKNPDAKNPDAKNPDAKNPDTKAPDAKAPTHPNTRTWGFDDAAVGTLPSGFTIAQTGEKAPPAKWSAFSSDDAPSGTMTLGITENSAPSKTFHTALADGTSYRDVEIDVMIKAIGGVNNRGGGVVFRAKGPEDYYVARWNPVETNFRVYSMLGGARVDLASAPLELDEESWHHLHVSIVGDEIKCSMDDQEIATVKDKAIPDAGMVGVWVKGDAQSLFDDLTAKAL